MNQVNVKGTKDSFGIYGNRRPQIIALLKEGKSYSQISRMLGISASYVGKINRKSRERGEL